MVTTCLINPLVTRAVQYIQDKMGEVPPVHAAMNVALASSLLLFFQGMMQMRVASLCDAEDNHHGLWVDDGVHLASMDEMYDFYNSNAKTLDHVAMTVTFAAIGIMIGYVIYLYVEQILRARWLRCGR